MSLVFTTFNKGLAIFASRYLVYFFYY